mmetsp:Transcript_1557/g.3357  ORF Transcript_1557/g.3357 Transcript_1557/m.3357 type:complete len:319 (+) Transcript_1557:131-1087(+)
MFSLSFAFLLLMGQVSGFSPPPSHPGSYSSYTRRSVKFRTTIVRSSESEDSDVNRQLEMFARFRQRGKQAGALAASGGSEMNSQHPAVRNLSKEAFAAAPPVFSTKSVDKGSGVREIHLLWFPSKAQQTSEDWVAQDGDEEAEAVVVGKAVFFVPTSDQVLSGLERALCVRISEFKNLDILEPLRGHGGAELLVNHMARFLAAEWGPANQGLGLVVLRHLDRGSGKLVAYYKRLGFSFAPRALPDTAVVRGLLESDSQKQLMVADLQVLLAQSRPGALRNGGARSTEDPPLGGMTPPFDLGRQPGRKPGDSKNPEGLV